jgi:hypothetical protein
MNPQLDHEPAIACDLTAIGVEQRDSHLTQAKHLLSQVTQEIQELADGYAFRFAADDYPQVAAFIANERLCCPFFTFVLEVPSAQRPLWLRITGGEGVKEFLQTGVGI